jgi:hypothetical protein
MGTRSRSPSRPTPRTPHLDLPDLELHHEPTLGIALAVGPWRKSRARAGDTFIRLEGEGGGTLHSALDAKVHVGDTGLPLEDPAEDLTPRPGDSFDPISPEHVGRRAA